jgi:FkbH-like protein
MSGIKCVIWDLDNTLWDGICLEDAQVTLKPGIREVLALIQSRGIVQSVASKNEPAALDFVMRFDLNEFFVYPQVNWSPKEENIRAIATKLNIGLDAVAFVDDNPFELESVAQLLPGVRTYSALDYQRLPELAEMQMAYDTPEARERGRMYVDEAQRREAEDGFEGRKQEFMRSLQMRATPRIAEEAELPRISELVTRTNQFNSTGIRYTPEEIAAFFHSPEHTFHVVSLVDRFGDYGRCGVALIRSAPHLWSIEILLVSCRVAGRGLGTAFISHISNAAMAAGCSHLRAKYIRTDRNRQIGLLYKVMGFNRDAAQSNEESSVFVYDLAAGPAPCPDWIQLVDSPAAAQASAEGKLADARPR